MNSLHYTEILNKLDNRQRQSFESFCNTIRERSDFEVADLIVFGSITKRILYNSSDIDIAVISDYFIPIAWTQRIGILKSSKFKTHSIISPLGLSTFEIANYEYPSIIKVIREQGLKISF